MNLQIFLQEFRRLVNVMQNKVIIDGIEFEAIAAITDDEQIVGLMYRQWPPPVMFFPYKKADIRKFWMKNTISPLDIIFCLGHKIIDIKSGSPHSTTMIGPNEPVDLVIEFPKGTAEKYGFSKGSIVSVKYSAETAAKYLLTS